MPNTETMSRLYLELSQFVDPKTKTARELELEKQLREAVRLGRMLIGQLGLPPYDPPSTESVAELKAFHVRAELTLRGVRNGLQEDKHGD